jgi:multidrug efflux system membrane fusion protein
MTVPATAVQQGSNGTYVYVINTDNTAALRPVDVASTEDNRSVITRGITKGERVVVEGQFKLEDGTHVRVVEHTVHDR